jgi:hypothetical protein
MVEDHLVDMMDDSGHLWLRGWRCIICGEVIDPCILRQRHRQQVGVEQVVDVNAKRTRRPRQPVRVGPPDIE